MNQFDNPYQSFGMAAADAQVDARSRFIRLTYLHLAGAVMAFLLLEALLLSLPVSGQIAGLMLSGRWSWMIVLLAFMGISTLAERWARSSTSKGTQYMGLGVYVVAEAIVFLPLMLVASHFGRGVPVIPIAGFLTLFIFAGLTAIVLLTGANFSFLGTALKLAGWAALAVIVCSAIFGFNLGLLFIGAMVFLAAGYILYDTSNVLHNYRVDQHVAASLALFASVALLFWYILQLVMRLSSRD